jgi:hypothetical protein
MRPLSCLVFLVCAASVSASTITREITSGTADLTVDLSGGFIVGAAESFFLSGPGLSFSRGGFSSGIGLLGFGTEIPSEFVDLNSSSSGELIYGSLAVDGESEDFVFPAPPPGGGGAAELDFVFHLTTPRIDSNGMPYGGTLSGPFTANASFSDSNFHSGDVFRFSGQGTVTAIGLTLYERSENPYGIPFVPSAWALESLHFDFEAPEPGTSSLLIAGIVLFGFLRLLVKYHEHFIAS